MKRATLAVIVTAAALLGYVAGTNASWVTNAVYVAHLTHRPVLAIVDPLHRPWLRIAIESARITPPEADDEELARAVESERG